MKRAIAETKKAQGMPANTFFNVMLAEVERVMESPISYFASVENDETMLIMRGWSRSVMGNCAMIDKPLVYKLTETGLWGDAVRERKTVITNDYPALVKPTKKGHPEGHVKVTRHMNVPLQVDGKILGVAGVGNRDKPYEQADGDKLIELMQTLWPVIKTKCV